MYNEKSIMRLLILLLVSLILSSCSNIDYNDQYILESLKESKIDKIILDHYDYLVTIENEDKNFAEIINLSSSIKLKNEASKKYLNGKVIFVKFYSKDKLILVMDLRSDYIFVNAKLYKYTRKSKDNAQNLEKILSSYFDIN